MLKTRVLTAVVMLAVFLPSLFFLSQRQWGLFAAGLAGVAAWEWGGLMRWKQGACLALGLALAGFCLGFLLLAPQLVGVEVPAAPGHPGILAVYAVAAIFWALAVPAWLSRKWPLAGSGLGAGIGLVVIFPTWLALVQLRLLGPAILLAILAVVWIADIAAYFSGRAFGRHKLAPAISPGKTWEGAIGAVVAVVVYGLLMRQFVAGDIALGLWLPGLVAVTAVSILGDLYESLLKRQVGLKDSSQILPGHGGVLDRIDSLTSTLPLVALLWLLFSSSPA